MSLDEALKVGCTFSHDLTQLRVILISFAHISSSLLQIPLHAEMKTGRLGDLFDNIMLTVLPVYNIFHSYRRHKPYNIQSLTESGHALEKLISCLDGTFT